VSKRLSELPQSIPYEVSQPSLELASRVGRVLQKSWFWAWLDTLCQYRRSRIGPLWETLNVAVMIGGLTLVSSAVFGGSVIGHLSYIGAGVIAWAAISAMITEGPNTFVRYSSLIKDTNIGDEVYVGRTVFKVMITFAHHLLIYAIGVLFLIVPFGWASLLTIPGIMLVFVNGCWVVTLLGFVCARFRDVELIVRNLLQLAFFVTPVFWDYQQIPPGRRFIVDFNVLFHFLEIVRAPLLCTIPSFENYAVVAVVTIAGSAVTILVRQRMHRALAFYV
jgi:ABC-type polysaccharide/polyol phosphate export permease